MGYQFLNVDREGKIATVALNRPEKRNALSIALRNEIEAALGAIEDDDGVSCVVLVSEGPVFCAGFDTKEFLDRSPEHLNAFNDSSERFHRRLAEFSKPLIAGIQGPAMGGGFDLAVLCDIRLATSAARFAHPEIKFGAPALFGPLREIVGGGIARELVLTGRTIDAAEAQRLGLLTEIVEPGQLRSACLRVAGTVAEAPLPALRAIKQQIVRSYGGWNPNHGDAGLLATLARI